VEVKLSFPTIKCTEWGTIVDRFIYERSIQLIPGEHSIGVFLHRCKHPIRTFDCEISGLVPASECRQQRLPIRCPAQQRFTEKLNRIIGCQPSRFNH